jgi:cytochrome c oxidase subunit 4
MSEPHAPDAAHHGEHEGHISDSTFLKVFIILAVFTAVSWGTNVLFGSSGQIANNPVLNFLIIGIVACVKATLVIMFFMHLKIDWRKVFVFLIPICILAPMVIMVLWPDIVLAWRLKE